MHAMVGVHPLFLLSLLLIYLQVPGGWMLQFCCFCFGLVFEPVYVWRRWFHGHFTRALRDFSGWLWNCVHFTVCNLLLPLLTTVMWKLVVTASIGTTLASSPSKGEPRNQSNLTRIYSGDTCNSYTPSGCHSNALWGWSTVSWMVAFAPGSLTKHATNKTTPIKTRPVGQPPWSH